MSVNYVTKQSGDLGDCLRGREPLILTKAFV